MFSIYDIDYDIDYDTDFSIALSIGFSIGISTGVFIISPLFDIVFKNKMAFVWTILNL